MFPPKKPTSREEAAALLEAVRNLREMAAACLKSAENLDFEMSGALANVTEWAREWGIDA